MVARPVPVHGDPRAEAVVDAALAGGLSESQVLGAHVEARDQLLEWVCSGSIEDE